MNDEVIKYIRANRDAYTREAINQVLLNAGHSPEDIAAGWQAIEEEDERFRAEMEVQLRSEANDLTGPKGRGCLGAVWFLVVVAGIVLIPLTNIGLSPGMFGLGSVTPESQRIADVARIVVNAGTVILGIGLVIATVQLIGKNWPLDKVAVVVVVIAAVWYMIVLGTCLYAPRVL